MAADSDQEPGWASFGFALFAAALLITTGLVLAVYGLSELFFSNVGTGTDTVVAVSAEAWAVVYTIGGIVLFLAGCNIFVGRFWARAVGIAVAVVALVGGLVSLDSYPVFALVLIVINLGIIWSLGFRWNAMRSAM